MGGGGHPAVTQAPSPLPPYTSAHLSCVAISINCIPTEGTGWDGNRAEEGYAVRKGWTLAHHQKGCLELYQGKETGRTETASGTAHLFNKCSLSWAVSALSQRKFKCFGNLGGISGWTDSWSRAGTFPLLQTAPVPHRNFPNSKKPWALNEDTVF